MERSVHGSGIESVSLLCRISLMNRIHTKKNNYSKTNFPSNGVTASKEIKKTATMNETISFNYLIITIATILYATVNGIECVVNEFEIFSVNCFSFVSHEPKTKT